MAIFEAQSKLRPGSRSNTKLEVSGHESPAELWVTDPNLPVLFNYQYGGWAQKEVVIAKGVMVSVGPQVLDDEFGKLKNTITIANGTNAVIGMSPYNVTKHYPGFLTGNRPAIITEDYVELPYIPNTADAAQVQWGLLTGANLVAGDLVKPNAQGKLTKWIDGTDSIKQICGQILAFELDQEPFGWLKWAMWDETARQEDQGPQTKTGYSLPPDSGFPFDPNYRNGVRDVPGYWTPWTVDPTGIPGLQDGSQRAQTIQSYSSSIASGTPIGTVVFNLGMKNVVEGTVGFFINGAPVATSAFTVDYANGTLSYALTSSPGSSQSVSIQFRSNFYGTPAGWDYRGAVGAARILLKF